MTDKPSQVVFPEFDDKALEEKFRKDTVKLATELCAALNNYLDGFTPDEAPHAQSVGAACFLTAYLTGLRIGEPRKSQLSAGLIAMAMLNSENDTLDLATTPPLNERPM